MRDDEGVAQHHVLGIDIGGSGVKGAPVDPDGKHVWRSRLQPELDQIEKLAKSALQALAKDASKETIDQLALQTNLSELGRFVVTRNRSDIGAFKTSQLRNVGISGPYMHDGSLSTLWDVIDHYNKGGEANLYLDGGIEPLALSEPEVDQLVAFLFSLTDDHFKAENEAELKRQKAIAINKRPFRDNELASRKVFVFERRLKGGK